MLVVEDDAAINKVVCSYLEKRGAACTAAFSGTEGLLRLEGGDFDLLITDLMLPGAAGEDVVAAAVAARLPVIVLSARATVADRVDLLQLGADDYLVKPFDLEELDARIEAVLRRYDAHAGGEERAEHAVLRYGSWVLDPAARTFVAAGASVYLTPTEFAMVEALMAEPARVHTKRNLSTAAAGSEVALEDKAVATHIGNIRAKLRTAQVQDLIETVWGVGFKLQDLS
ncbi:response regulator transcription factor [Adlercreutzia equolifaciens]|uniref:response regulator transcription factor n=1 Tax=Adlercreutzia equolifaciens TaxID=446660 RepID=UPI0023AEF8FC|nr:response regulator transcription factor [Adlercreutzia equolifaciens]MDE8702755.1 response regulator transcription factor [Adlercreutzia equolifaciens]